MPTSEELHRFYADLYYQDRPAATYQADYPEDELLQRRLRADALIHAVTQALGPKEDNTANSLLEVGCGEGFVLQSAANAGFSVHGIDFSDFAIQRFHPAFMDCFEAGDAYALLDRKIDAGETYNTCVLQNVVEHVIDPGLLLEKVKTILAPGGILAAMVPNDYSRLQKKALELGLIDREYWFAPPAHLHYFNTENFRPFVEALGFSVVDQLADFPIELFLFHEGSNYVRDPDKGKAAHHARVTLDLLLAESGLNAYVAFCRALSGCGMGRNVMVILRQI